MEETVRRAEPRDAVELSQLNRDEAEWVVRDPTEIESSLRHNSTEKVFVVELDGCLVGFATVQLTTSFAYQRPNAELTAIDVLPRHRRKGLGSGLMKAIREYCEELNVLELFLRVNKSNSQALRFYKHCGLGEADHSEYRLRYYR